MASSPSSRGLIFQPVSFFSSAGSSAGMGVGRGWNSAVAAFCSARRFAMRAQISGTFASENSLKEYSAQPTPSNTRTTKPAAPPVPEAEMPIPARLMRQSRRSSASASTEA